MAQYTVRGAVKTKDVPGQHGPMQVIALALTGPEGEINAEWFTKATTPLPQPGQQIEGTVEQSQYGPKFKKAPSGAFAGGGRSPEENSKIVRQHSQEMALRYWQAQATRGHVPENAGMAELRVLIDWFERDALEGWKRNEQPQQPAYGEQR